MPTTRPACRWATTSASISSWPTTSRPKFNHDYGVAFFPVIEPLILGPAARVMSLRDGTKKMSKSDPSDQSRINLTDDADTIALKIRRAKHRPGALARRPPKGWTTGRRRATWSASMPRCPAPTTPACCAPTAGHGFGAFKEALAALVVEKLAPIAAETRRWLAAPDAVDARLQQGAERAAAIADPIVAEAERLVGFLKPRR